MKSIKDKVLKEFTWEKWLERDFSGIVLPMFYKGGGKANFKKIGLTNWEQVATVFNDGAYYHAPEVYTHVTPVVNEWLKNNSISQLNDQLDVFYEKNRKKIIKMAEEPEKDTFKKLKVIVNICEELSAYIWGAHIIEHVLLPQLKEKTAKYIKGDINKFIGDASFPTRKNALELMEDEIRKGVSINEIVKKYAWMKSRNGFDPPYAKNEIEVYAKNLKKKIKHKYPVIPPSLKKIFFEAQESVYLRTKRTDVLYEFLFLARPIFRVVAKHYKIPFNQIKRYDIYSLLKGEPFRFPKRFAYLVYKDKAYLSLEPLEITSKNKNKDDDEIKGNIAQKGVYRGRVRIIMFPSEMDKVKKGDVLVTYMTQPNFLPAMKKASAFVTNEGGLTCHAAIVAREMKKPCIIGTKIATEVLKDDYLVEVNADEGVVKIIERK